MNVSEQRAAERLKQRDAESEDRTEEEGEASGPDAPTAARPKEGMSTILGTEPISGVQGNRGDE